MMDAQSKNLIVECAEDCGNSPKKKLLKDLAISFAKKDIPFCMDWLTDDVSWELIGEKRIQGKEKVENALCEMSERDVKQLQIHNIITHGNAASLNATFILKDNWRIDFCNVYNFRGFGKNAKIKAIDSYVIQTSRQVKQA